MTGCPAVARAVQVIWGWTGHGGLEGGRGRPRPSGNRGAPLLLGEGEGLLLLLVGEGKGKLLRCGGNGCWR